MLYFILFIILLFYIYENWQAFNLIIHKYFTTSSTSKESFTDTLKSSNGYTSYNYADYSSNVLVPPPLQANKLRNPLLALQEARREKSLQDYNLAVTEFNNKLDALRVSGDITLQGILVLQGELFPRYKLISDVLHSKNFFKVKESPMIIAQKVASEESTNPNKITPYLQLIENLRLSGAMSDDDILVIKYKIITNTNMAVIQLLNKDNIRTFTQDESEFLKSCMLEIQYITASGLESIKNLVLPDASGVLEPVVMEENETIASEFNESELLILKGKPVYTRMDISDAVINTDFDNSNDINNINGEEDWQGVCKGSRCSDINSRIKAYCQRPWYECHSHIPSYGMKYYYN
jgi:hypothetical protein